MLFLLLASIAYRDELSSIIAAGLLSQARQAEVTGFKPFPFTAWAGPAPASLFPNYSLLTLMPAPAYAGDTGHARAFAARPAGVDDVTAIYASLQARCCKPRAG